ncbi:MAG TPA: DUF1996 domain-containing protein [Thermopolyspora sp.]
MTQRQPGRPRFAGRMAAAFAAAAVAGSGLAAATPADAATTSAFNPGSRVTVSCPSVADKLPMIPADARIEVSRDLRALDAQIAGANRRLARLWGRADADLVRNAVLNPLSGRRAATLERVSIAIRRAGGERPVGLGSLVNCTIDRGDGGASPTVSPSAEPSDGASAEPTDGASAEPGDGAQPSASPSADANGPSPDDFVDIRRVRPNRNLPRFQRNGSRGTFTSFCGRNENRHFNSDNVITAPGVSNGAHHVHDYVGNLDTSGQSTNESLAASGTTCTNGDKSAYFWPVVRLTSGSDSDANSAGGGLDGNVGKVLRPASAVQTFVGNPTSKVVAMPEFMRIITGDAKAFTNGTANANASWTCTGFENRRLEDKYPLCPRGSRVERIFEFQSCWDGVNADSANHRSHVTFVQDDGSCPEGFKAIPRLVQRITYSMPPGPVYAVDSFPDQAHKPITDHSDFINVMPTDLMRRAVDCINSGRRCR